MKLDNVLTKRLLRNATSVALVAGAAISLFSPLVQTAIAAPTGATVVAGQVGITRRGDVTRIRASDGAIINFQQFNIAPNETVRFLQPSSTAKVLNRITGNSPTTIEGRLFANGQVYLVNPFGVTFSRDAVVSVGGIVAAAGNMTDADFKSGLLRFTDSTGNVVNAGTIQANNLAFIGRQVSNSGQITVPDGTVVLAAGENVFVGQRNGRVFVKIENPAAGSQTQGVGLDQSGTIDAPGSEVSMGAGDLYSLALRHSGQTIGRDIQITGEGNARVQVSGDVSARNQGANNTGGRIEITGADVAVSSASIDASGQNGGGTVLLGGEYRGGSGPDALRRADTVIVSSDSSVEADATQKGNGGTIVAWSNDRTEIHGSLSASGGTQGGNGGLIETSSAGSVLIPGTAEINAKRGAGGKAGLWLLDPTDVTIATSDPMDGTTFTNVSVVQAALDAGTDFTVEADNNILVTSQITTTPTADVTLTFRAGNDINLAANIGATGSFKLNLAIFADTFPTTLATNNVGSVNIANAGAPSAQPVLALNGGTFRSVGVNFTIGNGLGNIQGASSIQFEHSGPITGLSGTINTGGSSFKVLQRPTFALPTLTLGTPLNITSGGGDVQIDGSIAGAGNGITINAGSGKITLGAISGAGAVNLTSSNVASDAISVLGVGSTGLQLYTGNTTLNGAYTTGGSAFTVTGAAVLAGNTSVNTANGLLTFNSTIKSDGTARSLSLAAGNNRIVLQGIVGSAVAGEKVSTFSATSTNANINAITAVGVNSTGDQTFTGRTLISGDYNTNNFLITGPGIITGNVTAGGTFGITGAANLDGTFSSVGAFTLGSDAQFVGSITTTNALFSIAGGLTLGGNSTIGTGSGNISLSSFLAGGNFNLGLNSTGATLIVGAIDSVGTLTTNAGGTSEFRNSVSNTGSLVIGDALTVRGASYTTTGSQSFVSITADALAPSNVSFLANGITSGAVAGGSKNLSFNAGTGKLLITGNVTDVVNFDAASSNAAADAISVLGVASTGSQSYIGKTTLNGTYTTGGSNFGVTGPATFGGLTSIVTSGGLLSFSSTIDGGGQQLVLNAVAGKISIGGDATNISQLVLASTNAGDDAIAVSGVTSSGSQTYNGNTTLNGTSYQTTNAGITFNNKLTLNASPTISTGSGNVTFADVIAKTGPADANLTVTSSGTTIFRKNVTVGDLLVNGGGTTQFAPSVVSPTITITATSIRIDDNVTLASSAGGTAFTFTTAAATGMATKDIFFGGTIQGTPSGVSGLVLDAGGAMGGSITVTGAIGGGGNALGSFSTSGNLVTLNGAVTSVGGTNVGGANVVLSGAYNTGGADFIVAGPLIFISGTDVTINSGGGLISLTGVLNGGTKSLSLLNFSTATFNGNASNLRDVTVSAPGGQVTFNGSLSGNGLGALSITGVGPNAFTGDVSGFTTVNVDGPITLGGDISSSGAMTLGNLTLTGAARIFTGTNITLGTINGGGANVTINDTAVTNLNGNITNVNQFFTSAAGSTRLANGVTINAVRALIRDDVVLVGGSNSITTTGATGITLNKTVNGPAALTLDSSAGNGRTEILGIVGGSTALTSLTITGNTIAVDSARTTGAQLYTGDTTLTGISYLTTDSNFTINGGTTVSGSAPRTITLGTGAAGFNGAFQSQGGAVTIDAGSARFFSTLTGGGSDITINSAGQTRFDADITGVGTLTTNVGGTSLFNGNFDGGSLVINDAATLNGGTYFTTGFQSFANVSTAAVHTGVNLSFGDINGLGGNVTLNDSGTTNLNGNVTNTIQFFTSLAGSTRLASGKSITADRVLMRDSLVLLGGANTITTSGANGIRLEGSVNGPAALTLSATGGGITILGPVGDSTALTSLEATGTTISVANVATTGTQTYNGPSTFTGTNYTTQNAALTVNGTGTFNNTGSTSVATNGGLFKVTGVSTFSGSDVTLNSGGGAIQLDGASTIGTQNVGVTTINTGNGNLAFGANTTFNSGSTQLSLGSGNLTITGTSLFRGPTVGITSSGGDLTFTGASTLGTAASGSTTIATGGGDVNFSNSASFNSATTSISTGGGAFGVASGARFATGTATISTTNGNLSLDVLNSVNSDLVLSAGSGNISLNNLLVAATGPKTLVASGATINTSGVFTTGNQTYNGALALISGATLAASGAGNIIVNGPLTLGSNAAITTNTGFQLFRGNITGAGRTLTLNSARNSGLNNAAYRFGSSSITLGTLTFNTTGTAKVTLPTAEIEVATIVFSDKFNADGSLGAIAPSDNFLTKNISITTPNGFVMSQQDRIVALGNLTINAGPSGTATLGSIAALGQLNVTAGAVQTFRGSQFVGADGLTISAGSVNDIASTINPSDQFTLFGRNPGKAASVPGDIVARTVELKTPLNGDRYIAGNVRSLLGILAPFPGIADTATITPVVTADGSIRASASNFVNITGSISDQEASRLTAPGIVGDLADDLLDSLDLRSKNLEASDLITFFMGRNLYIDLPRSIPASTGNRDYGVTRNRLQPQALAEAVQALDALVGTTRPEPGQPQDKSKLDTRLESLNKTLEESWQAFREKDPEGGSKQYIVFVETTPSQSAVNQIFAEIRGVMQRVDGLGLSRLETRIIKRAILDKVVPGEEFREEMYNVFGVNDSVSAR